MKNFRDMTFEQAMKYIACHDVFLKWQESNADADEWLDISVSLHRAYQYLRTLRNYNGEAELQWTVQHEQAIHSRCNDEVFPTQYEFGTDAWFIQLGCVLFAIKNGWGWFTSRYSVHTSMMRVFDMVNDNTFIEHITEAIREGDTALHICDHCDQFCHDPVEIHNGDSYVCQRCTDNDYLYDDYNDHWFPSCDSAAAIGPEGEHWIIDCESDTSDFTWDDYHGRYVHDDYNDHTGVIQGYHSHCDNFRQIESAWSKSNKRFFGVELEVEANDCDRDDAAQGIHDWFANNRASSEQLFFEEDGSLSYGFEMITQPMGLDKHREIWKWVEQKQLIKGLRSHNTNTCGLHVHVSKAGLSSLTISKAVCFVNNPSNMSLIKAIARRYDSGYCRPKHVTLAKGHKNGDKYEMLNIGKRSTIEFRMFRGSLNYNAIQAALEFSNAVVNFAQATSMEELTEQKYLEFIYKPEQRMDTKFLRAYLEQRSPRIKDIVDRIIKPMYKLRVIKPEPVEVSPDEPKVVPEPRRRGSERQCISYPEDIEPPNPNQQRTARSDLQDALASHLNAYVSTLTPNATSGEMISNRWLDELFDSSTRAA